jgi:hypothetical protein
MDWFFLTFVLIVIGVITVVFYFSYKNATKEKTTVIIPEIITEYEIIDPTKPIVFEYSSTSVLYTQIAPPNTTAITPPLVQGDNFVVPPNTNAGFSPAAINNTNNITVFESPTGASSSLQTGISCLLSNSGVPNGSVSAASLRYGSGRGQPVASTSTTSTIYRGCAQGLFLNEKKLDIVPKINSKDLPFTENYVTKMNLYNAGSLENLEVFENGLTEILFTKTPILKYVDLTSNFIQNINLSKVTSLEIFKAPDNNFNYIDFSNNTKLTELNLSNNLDLANINVKNLSNLKTLTLENVNTNNTGKIYLENIDSLTSLENVTASSLEVSQIESLPNKTSITTLNLMNSGLTSIDLSSFTNIEVLYISYNDLSTLDLSPLVNLKTLDVTANPSLLTLDLTSNTTITQLNFNDINGINIIGISGLSLTGMAFDGTNYNPDLTQPEFSNLTSISGKMNSITSIDVTNLTQMKFFDFDTNNITSITGLSSMTEIIYLNLANNSLDSTSIDDIFITINNFNTSNGNILVSNNSPVTSSSLTARTELLSRGWTLEYD